MICCESSLLEEAPHEEKEQQQTQKKPSHQKFSPPSEPNPPTNGKRLLPNAPLYYLHLHLPQFKEKKW
ncbi:hypothetical protein ACOSQ4_024609 [Xanthoceras sorbifolium]